LFVPKERADDERGENKDADESTCREIRQYGAERVKELIHLPETSLLGTKLYRSAKANVTIHDLSG
jgi:hypothetical protein